MATAKETGAANSKEIETLVGNLAKAKAAEAEAEAKLTAKLGMVPLGTIFEVNGEKMHVIEEKENRKDDNAPMVRRLVYLFTARQRAILAGKEPPTRVRRTKAQREADRLAEAKALLERANGSAQAR